MIEDAQNLQLSYNHISHEADTEDIADDVNPSNYDAHHSKAWNDAVEKKASEAEEATEKAKSENQASSSKIEAAAKSAADKAK